MKLRYESFLLMLSDHDFSGHIILIYLLVFINNLFFILITIMLLIIHRYPLSLKLLDSGIIFYKPHTICLKVDNIIYGYVQKPNHNIKLFLIESHDIVYPQYQHCESHYKCQYSQYIYGLGCYRQFC